jgi:hypothetical protein
LVLTNLERTSLSIAPGPACVVASRDAGIRVAELTAAVSELDPAVRSCDASVSRGSFGADAVAHVLPSALVAAAMRAASGEMLPHPERTHRVRFGISTLRQAGWRVVHRGCSDRRTP